MKNKTIAGSGAALVGIVGLGVHTADQNNLNQILNNAKMKPIIAATRNICSNSLEARESYGRNFIESDIGTCVLLRGQPYKVIMLTWNGGALVVPIKLGE